MDNTGKNMKEILKKVYYLERINYEQGKMINCLSQEQHGSPAPVTMRKHPFENAVLFVFPRCDPL